VGQVNGKRERDESENEAARARGGTHDGPRERAAQYTSFSLFASISKKSRRRADERALQLSRLHEHNEGEAAPQRVARIFNQSKPIKPRRKLPQNTLARVPCPL
jgi:hypothetical protein